MCKSDITPFKMHNQIYFVGSTRVSVHIIKTDVGLIMIDTGWPDMYEQILDSMKCLDLDPKDICAIFHSHGEWFGVTEDEIKRICDKLGVEIGLPAHRKNRIPITA